MIVGTAGHVDHGKTALVRWLTGIDMDRLKEERARGITIDLGFAYMNAPDGAVIGFIDVPGHEKFVHNMLAGATGIDFVLLVVAADDGVMPQTREHLAIVDLLNIPRGLVALTKSDLVETPRRQAIAAEIASLLEPTGLAGAEIIPVSAVSGEGMEALRSRLFAAAQTRISFAEERRFRLAIDRLFTLHGVGTVVTGTVLSGAVTVGDRLVISPSGLTVRVRNIHAQNRSAESGTVGQRCALNLVGEGVGRDTIRRGDVVLDVGLHAPTDRIDALLRVLPSEPRPIGQWFPVRLHHAAAEVAAHIVLLGNDPIPPGGKGLVQLVLEEPVAASAGDYYVLREGTAQRTLGGGRFIDLRAPARKRRSAQRLAVLAALSHNDPERAISALVQVPPYHIELASFARDHALKSDHVERIATRLALICVLVGKGVIALTEARWLELERSVIAALGLYHSQNPDLSGMGLERLRLDVGPWLPMPDFRACLQQFARCGSIALAGAWARLAGHEVHLTRADETLWSVIAPLLGGKNRFRPPRVREICVGTDVREGDVRRLLKGLSRMGIVDEIALDHFFLRGTVAEMVAIIAALAADTAGGQFVAAQFRDKTNNGRKVAIQILEFFDRHGVTLRCGDQRRLNKHRLDLFGSCTRENDVLVDRYQGREASPVGRPDFKSGRGREAVPGGFDSHSLPPPLRKVR